LKLPDISMSGGLMLTDASEILCEGGEN